MHLDLRCAIAFAWGVAVGMATVTSAGAEERAASGPGAPTATDAASLPANTWVRLVEGTTGGREQPVFVYAEKIGRFVRAAGMQSYGGEGPRHYDTEEFDFATRRWVNAYPAGVGEGRPESGPVGETYSKERAKQGYNGAQLFYKDGPHVRVGAGGQWMNGKSYGEFCFVPDRAAVFAYVWDRTLKYDVAARTWTDLEAAPRAGCRIWGSLCHDPVHGEILHAGGDGGSRDLGTWVYGIAENEWRQLEFGSDAFRALAARGAKVRRQAQDLQGRVASRHASAETDEEARDDLAARAGRLASDAHALVAAIESAPLEGAERRAGSMAVERIRRAVASLSQVAKKLAEPILPERIAAVRSVRAEFDRVVDALASEPPGRARSQLALDAANRKIVLFGGDGLDRTLSDTWVYDCATRAWEQRFPENSPAPRAGHVLAWLPKSQRIVLAGGYSRSPLPQEVWSYDVAADAWTLLRHVPQSGLGESRAGRDAPKVSDREIQSGAVGPDDVLVCLDGPHVWACRVDPAAPQAAPESAAERAVAAGTYDFQRIDPATWETADNPTAPQARKFLDDLPVNQWTAFEFPKYAPGARNRWGTTAYDADRHQFLFWGGGHATSQHDDVAHFGVRGGFWTVGYAPDEPIERVYASQPTPVSFRDRVHVPIHAYKAYCCDPTARRMFYLDRAYDPLVRDWDPAPLPGLEHRGPMHSQMESTPRGAVTYSESGLFRFDARAGRWNRLPWTGPAFGRIWCDGHALCFDAKRDCLWFANDATVLRYDLPTGKAERVEVDKPRTLGQWMLWSEQVHLPPSDLILLMRLFAKPDGTLANVVWDPQSRGYFSVDLPFVVRGERTTFREPPFSWSDAIAYDPQLDLVLLNNSSAGRVWALRFDRATARLSKLE